MKTKKGDVWVSAILYFGLGIIILTVILTAGTPVINRLRDKNIVIQTKEVMHILDDNIRQVAREGPGAQRPLALDIRKGEFTVDEKANQVVWTYKTKALLSEPCFKTDDTDCDKQGLAVKEGTLNILTKGTKGVKEYDIKVWLDYKEIHLVVPAANQKIVGRSDLVIRNGGLHCVTSDGSKVESKPDARCTSEKPRIGVIVNTQT